MAVTRDTVLMIAPELADVPAEDQRWSAFLTDAEQMTNRAGLGETRADQVVKYLVAHLMTVAKDADDARADGSAGEAPLKSITVGPVTKVFDTAAAARTAADPGDFKSTSYGVTYLRLIRMSRGARVLV